jgi:hypothetical protein
VFFMYNCSHVRQLFFLREIRSHPHPLDATTHVSQFNLVDVPSPNGRGAKKKGKSGRTAAILNTSASSNTFEERAASVLGTKLLSGLARVEIDLSEAVSQRLANNVTASTKDGNGNAKVDSRWKVEGLVSHAPASPRPEVMFTEEASVAELMRLGLMDLWSGESEGKFAANEVEDRTNAAKGGGGGAKSGIEMREGSTETNIWKERRKK